MSSSSPSGVPSSSDGPVVLPQLRFGATGHNSTRLIFGAAALGSMRQDRADQTLETMHAAGINHVDTAASYGESELRLEPWLADHRQEVFLATKTGERDGSSARAELERSLQRLGVEQVDLIQLHNLVEEDEWQVAFAPGGAVSALAQARDEGLVRFIGVTGHGTRIAAMHLRSLREFPFASVLFPLNYAQMAIESYRRDVEALMAYCTEHDVAMQTIKSIARRRWLPGDDQAHFSWYEPLVDPDAIERAVRYVLSYPNVFLNTSSDVRWLPTIVTAAARFGETGGTAADRSAPHIDVENAGVHPLFDATDAMERI